MPQSNKQISLLRGSLLLSASFAMFSLSSTAMAQDSGIEDEVIAVGIRQSLKAAADLKRNDSRIVDAIVAEDIGKLPDNNIAEALQRITGVSINTDFGIGDSVSIRGLPQNRIELNGRSTAGDARGGVSLQDFPSSFLKSVEVIKSPTPDMIEGALGGTVRMNTMKPLDLKGLTIAGSLDGEYADKTENIAPIGALTAGQVWDLDGGGRFGIIGSVAYQDREIRQDFFHQRVQLYDIPGFTANTPDGRAVIGDQNTVEQDVERRERTALNLSLQYEPASGKGNLYLDLNTTDRSGNNKGSSILDVGGNGNITFGPGGPVQDENGRVENYTLNGAFVIPKTYSQFRNTESYSHALGGTWDFTDSLTVSAEASIAKSESFEPDLEFNLRPINRPNWEAWVAQGGTDFNADRTAFGLRHTIDAAVSRSGDELPSVVYSDGVALLSPENLAVRRFQYDDRRIDTKENALKFDVEYDNGFGLDFISKWNAGVRLTNNDHQLNHSRYAATNLYRNAFRDDGTPFAIWIDQFEAMFPGSFENVGYSNSFNQSGQTGRNDLLNYRIFSGEQLSDPQGSFAMIQQAFAGTNFATTGSLEDNLEVQQGSFRDIDEKTRAAYLSADIEFGNLSGVIGARYVETDLTSTVFQNGAQVAGENSYSDILPSVNLTYDASDNTKVRFAAAKVMRRPDFGQLSPAFEVAGNFATGTQGSLDLDPFRATQYDLSVEHYFGDGGLISGAVFYKDVASFFATETSCRADSRTITEQNVTEFQNVCQLTTAGVDNPVITFLNDEAQVIANRDAGLTGIRTEKTTNGEKGKVKGFEIGLQQQLLFLPGALANFGINANYTYADSEQPNGNALLDISKNTLNTQLYWENEKFQARVAYNYRSSFLDTEKEKRVETIGALGLGNADTDLDPTAGNNYRDGRGQVDASAAWIVNDHITLVANGSNLLGAPSVFSHELGSSYRYVEADRRFSLGVRAKY